MDIINVVVGIVIVLELLLFLLFLIHNKLDSKNKTLILFNIIILLVSFIIDIKKIDVINESLSYRDFMLVFIVIEVAFSLFLINKALELQKKYDKLINYIVEYERIIDDQGKKNHEYNNQLLVLKGYINNKKKMIEYLDTIIEDHRTGQNFEIRQLSNFPNGGIKELLYCKLARMKENDIKFYIYVSEEVSEYIEQFSIKMYKDITKLFGIFMDNAIDASIESKEKEVELDFKKDDNYLIITISNSYKKDSDLTKIGIKGYTTKGIGHGYGLNIVRDIVKSNKNIEVVTEEKNNMFCQTILIEI